MKKQKDIKEISKDAKAELFLGFRKRGTFVFAPEELGYACPICGYGSKNTDGDFQWSEYNSMLYCPKCNIDIPSCFCVKCPEPHISDEELSQREKIEKAKDIFYKTCENIIKRYKSLTDVKEK